MQIIKNISDFRLSKFLSKEIIEEKEFDYAGVDGVAEVLGWHIVIFRELENLECTSAISLSDANYNNELSDLVNLILSELNINLQVGDCFQKIKDKFGQPFSCDEVIEEMKRYNYLLDNNSIFACFGVDIHEGLISIEIISNKKIIDGIINEKWR
ncbi:MAG: hypothetical protein Q8900_02790 [Bacillota bacterium]|nr:hypothetical protein [Bacillota bacterium]